MKKILPFFLFMSLLAGLVYSAPAITVTKPAAGDNWEKNKTYLITWIKSGNMPDTVKIMLRNQSSTATIRELADGVPNSGSYQWAIPNDIPDGSYRIRVKVKGADVHGDSGIFNLVSGQPSPKTPMTKVPVKVAVQISPFLKVVQPNPESSWHNGDKMNIVFQAVTLPNDGLDIELYNETGSNKIIEVYSGGYGAGSGVIPEGPAHPNEYFYIWTIPFGDIMAPGWYKLRLYSYGKNLTAWSGRFHLTWPMKVHEYTLQASITNAMCVHNSNFLNPFPVRPRCEQGISKAHVGFDFFYYTDSTGTSQWHGFIHRAQLKFPIEQFQAKKPHVLEAMLLLKREGTYSANQSLFSCAGKVHRLDGPLLQGFDCWNTLKTFWANLPNDQVDMVVNLTGIVTDWINGAVSNNGVLLTSADESWQMYVTMTCLTCYTATLHLKLEEEFKGYD